MFSLLVFLVVFVPMFIEARRAASNEIAQRERGGIEAQGDVYNAMRLVYRVIVVPRAPLVTNGPYHFIRHPNYVAVFGELLSVALMTGARLTGPIAVVGFGLLILRRIGVEEKALRSG